MSAVLLGMAALQFVQASRQAKANEELQGAQNAEARRAGAEQQGGITQNILNAQERFVNASSNIDIAAMQSRSEAIVSAAAAGTSGLSVSDTLLDIERNAARAEGSERSSLEFSIAELERSRKGVQAQVANRTSHKDFGSTMTHALGAAVGYASNTYGKSWDFKSLKSTPPKQSFSPIQLPSVK